MYIGSTKKSQYYNQVYLKFNGASKKSQYYNQMYLKYNRSVKKSQYDNTFFLSLMVLSKIVNIIIKFI